MNNITWKIEDNSYKFYLNMDKEYLKRKELIDKYCKKENIKLTNAATYMQNGINIGLDFNIYCNEKQIKIIEKYVKSKLTKTLLSS